MPGKLHELALKKQRLELRSEGLRQEIANAALALQPSLAGVDRLAEGIGWLRRHPATVLAAVAGLLLARPRRLLRLAKRGWLLWLALRRFGVRPDKLLGTLTRRR